MTKLYRGFGQEMTEGETPNLFLERPRNPIETKLEFHNHADYWFEQRFGIRARSTTVICSTDYNQSKKFAENGNGTLAEISPISPFSLIYSRSIKDFIQLTQELEHMSITYSDVKNWLDYQNYQCVQSCSEIDPKFSGEVMVACDRYYLHKIPY
jgi:hypothetical protein